MHNQNEELLMTKKKKPSFTEWTLQNGVSVNNKPTATAVGAIHESPAKTTTVTTTKTQTRDPFLEGFWSVEDKPETERKTYLRHRDTPSVAANAAVTPPLRSATVEPSAQNPQPVKLPYRPSLQGPPKITKLPYIPAQDGTPKITQYETYSANPYGSPVKIVGDNVTEKDYEDFWEAFREESTGEKTYEDNFWGQFGANYQESRMEKEADEARYKYYKNPTPKNKKHFEDLKIELDNFRKNNAEVLADDASLPLISQGLAKIAPEIVDNVKNSLVHPGAIGAVVNAKDALQDAELHFMDKHYARNENNGDIPQHISELPEDWYREDLDYCHQFDVPGRDNQKYVSPDGKREVVFDANGYIVTDDKNKGTYNYYSAQTDKAGHFFRDMIPWYFWGNTPEDETTFPERVLSTFQIYTDGY